MSRPSTSTDDWRSSASPMSPDRSGELCGADHNAVTSVTAVTPLVAASSPAVETGYRCRRFGGEGRGTTLLGVTFYGVRGSTPCPCDSNARYGGNTACVVLETPGSDPIVLDLGTGVRFWGATQPHDGSFRAHALVTHLHFDHVQGLPFLAPADRPGAQLHIYAPVQESGESLESAFEGFIRPPYFPITWGELRGEFRFHPTSDCEAVVGDAKVMVRSVRHVGRTNGYRIELGGATVAYISDHQQPMDGSFEVTRGVRDLD